MEKNLLAETIPCWSHSNSVTRFLSAANPGVVRLRHSSVPRDAFSHSHCSTISVRNLKWNGNVARGDRFVVCYTGHGGLLSTNNLQMVAAISSLVLMLSRATAVKKPLLVPLFALQAPASIISWIKGEYGIWTAFLGLLLRLLFFIPGELDLVLMTLLLINVTPYKLIGLRGTQTGVLIAVAISSYLAFQHFSWAGNLKRAFEQQPLIASLAVILITVTSILFLL